MLLKSYSKVLILFIKEDVKKRPIFAHEDVSKRNSIFFYRFQLSEYDNVNKKFGIEYNTYIIFKEISIFLKKVSKNIDICLNISCSCSVFKVFPIDPELFINIIVFRSKSIKKYAIPFIFIPL